MNTAIVSLIVGKEEQQAIDDLNRFKRTWRIMVRDGQNLINASLDRNDKRYNLVINNGVVERVMFG